MKVWKLISGVLSILIFAIMTLQSCAVGISNSLSENGETSGTAGMIVAAMILTGGIVAIATRNSAGKSGDIAMIALYGLGAFVGISWAESYLDLYVWSCWAILCLIIAVIDACITRKPPHQSDGYYHPATKFCPKCGMELPYEAVCCWRCGYKPDVNS